MKKRVTLIDIANECGVTKGLVSRALAGKFNVSDETRNLIIQKATELGYDFGKLRSGQKKTSVLLIISSRVLSKENFWQPILQELTASLNRENIRLEYFLYDESNIDSKTIKNLLAFNKCGAFLFMHQNPDVLVNALMGLNKPIIEIDPKRMHNHGVTKIKFSNYSSIYEATERLISLGHKNIAFFGSDMHATSFRERHEGYLASMATHEELKPISIIFDNTALEYSDNALLEKALKDNKISALICANDICAINAYKVIKKMGFKVPDDISLIGFDNVKESEQMSPSLTTFDVPRLVLGRAIGLYLRMLFQNRIIKLSEVTITCEYIERNSIKNMKGHK